MQRNFATRQPVGTSVGRCSKNECTFPQGYTKDQPTGTSPPGQCHPVDPASAWNLLKGSAGGFWLFRICDLHKTSRTKHAVSRYLRFQQSPMFRPHTVHFFNIFLAGLLRFDPCMFVVSIIMDPDLIRIESYHSETLTLGATKTWAQNHLNTSEYLIWIYLLIFQ